QQGANFVKELLVNDGGIVSLANFSVFGLLVISALGVWLILAQQATIAQKIPDLRIRPRLRIAESLLLLAIQNLGDSLDAMSVFHERECLPDGRYLVAVWFPASIAWKMDAVLASPLPDIFQPSRPDW